MLATTVVADMLISLAAEAWEADTLGRRGDSWYIDTQPDSRRRTVRSPLPASR
jgi:hypothetical protein